MQKIRVKYISGSLVLNIEFSPLLFDWRHAPIQYFEMVYKTLGSIITINPSDFSVTDAYSLDKVSANYNILGGVNKVVLSAQNISIEIPTLNPEDSRLVVEGAGALYNNFPKYFPGHQFTTFRFAKFEHMDIVDGSSVFDYLDRYSLFSLREKFDGKTNTVIPGVRFTIINRELNWRSLCTIDSSNLLSNGLFVSYDIASLREIPIENFEIIVHHINDIQKNCLSALGLQRDFDNAN